MWRGFSFFAKYLCIYCLLESRRSKKGDNAKVFANLDMELVVLNRSLGLLVLASMACQLYVRSIYTFCLSPFTRASFFLHTLE